MHTVWRARDQPGWPHGYFHHHEPGLCRTYRAARISQSPLQTCCSHCTWPAADLWDHALLWGLPNGQSKGHTNDKSHHCLANALIIIPFSAIQKSNFNFEIWNLQSKLFTYTHAVHIENCFFVIFAPCRCWQRRWQCCISWPVSSCPNSLIMTSACELWNLSLWWQES